MNFYDIKPQVTLPDYGPEPSIMELLRYYYTSHGIKTVDAIRLSTLYIQQLEIDRQENKYTAFISGPNAYAFINYSDWMKNPLSTRWRREGVDEVICGLASLTGDDEEDYTLTMLNKGN